MELVYKGILEVLVLVLVVMTEITCADQRTSRNKGKINELNDIKEWKQLLRTKTNVLIYFSLNQQSLLKTHSEMYKILRDTAQEIRGVGTIAMADCNTREGKKLCKKVKASVISSSGESGWVLKHYHNGDFNKDYDRAVRVSSLITFMKDPTGDLPWEEEPNATSLFHLQDPQALKRLVKKEQKKGILVMFYAPWCGFCKKMKPDYVAASDELKNEAILAAIDVNRPENSEVRKLYNITGFPTLLYFRNGGMKQEQYDGENTKDGIVSFLRNPDAPRIEKPKEPDWSEETSHVTHLTGDTFEKFIKENPSVLVMFYAPWCGHCKHMKPAYVAAAEEMKNLEVMGELAAVDATRESGLAKKYDVNGYPTLKYFKNGLLAFDVGNVREEDTIIDFMRDPKEPPPPPPPEKPWADDLHSPVVHLTSEDFENVLKEREHGLVIFYAPWCGHCKQTKPEFIAAAEDLKGNPDVLFGAVDCTVEKTLCSEYEVKGYPTFKHFHYFNQEITAYNGGRTKQDFTNEVTPPGAEAKAFYNDWKGIAGSENIRKLTDENVSEFLKTHESVMVMFYAPWCGHCKTMKPDYARAATSLARDSPNSILAALDCVQYPRVMERYRIEGYPTLKYYRHGNFIGDFNGYRRTTEFINFMLRAPKSRDEL